MGEDEYDPPSILERPLRNTIKAIIYIGTGEVHMHFRRRRRNRNQRRQIIKDGWADYKGEVVKSGDIQLEQNCPEETVAPSEVWREKIVIAAETTDYAIQRIPGRLRKQGVPEDLKTLNALPRGKLGSYPFPFNYLK